MVETVLDVRDRVLKRGGKILPSKFDFYIEPIMMKDEYRVPFIWELNIKNIDFHCLNEFKSESKKWHFIGGPNEIEDFLSNPEPILSFDLETLPSITDIPAILKSERVATKNGRLDGFCVYFRAIFDNDIILDNSPQNKGQSHSNWGYSIMRVESAQIQAGDKISLSMEMNNLAKTGSWNRSYHIQPIQ